MRKEISEFMTSIKFLEDEPGSALPSEVELGQNLPILFGFSSEEIVARTCDTLREAALQRRVSTKTLSRGPQSIGITIAGCNKLPDDTSIESSQPKLSLGGLTDLLFDLYYQTSSNPFKEGLQTELAISLPVVLIDLIVAYVYIPYLEKLKIHLNKVTDLITYPHRGEQQKIFYAKWTTEKDRLFAEVCKDNPVLREQKIVSSPPLAPVVHPTAIKKTPPNPYVLVNQKSLKLGNSARNAASSQRQIQR
jgi:hypothetical protein